MTLRERIEAILLDYGVNYKMHEASKRILAEFQAERKILLKRLKSEEPIEDIIDELQEEGTLS